MTRFTFTDTYRYPSFNTATWQSLNRKLNADMDSIASSFSDLPTEAEMDQVKNIDDVTISHAQWEYVGDFDQPLTSADNVQFGRLTITDGIAEGATNSEMLIFGGTYGDGAYISVAGSTRATLANDIEFGVAGVGIKAYYDHSATLWTFSEDVSVTGNISLTGDAFIDRVGVGTASPTEALDVNSDAIRVRTSQTPASASAAGTAGTICWDSSYVYVCIATNTWKRAALSTW